MSDNYLPYYYLYHFSACAASRKRHRQEILRSMHLVDARDKDAEMLDENRANDSLQGKSIAASIPNFR